VLESITAFLTPSRAHAVLAVCRVLFYLLACLLLALLAWGTPARARPSTRSLRLFPLLFGAALLAILAYQTTWQLAGFTRREFVLFMERYNPRPDNAVTRIIRGSLLDRFGRVLAQTDPDVPTRRSYPFAESTAHIVGFRHPVEGLTGMESAADALLSGYWMDETLKPDFRETARKALRGERHVGTNVVLTIDADLHMLAQARFAGRKGAAVAIDPRNGAIRLLLSSPAFDPNHYDRMLNVDPDAPLLNRALHGRYAPGSTFKIAIAALLVESGTGEWIHCPAEGFRAPGANRPIRDHEYYSYERRGLTWPGFGTIGLDTALAKSANTYFAQAGVRCGTEAFNALAERLGFNARVPLYRSPTGMVSSQRGSLPWLGRGQRRELAQISIGQGRMTTTPLHMAMLTAAIANDGHLVHPRIVEAAPVEALPRVFSAPVARRVKKAMRHTVTSGTARNADIVGLDVCGKTGTAQNPGGDDHAWFVCFAPADQPELAIAIVVENAGYGSAAALPIAADILVHHFNSEARRRAEGR